MRFIDRKYFDVPPYEIPNLKESPNSFEMFVDDYEVKVLKDILGVELCNLFLANLDEDYPEEYYTQLRDGATYVINGITYEWVGLIGRGGALVPYMYALWTLEGYEKYSGTGFIVSKNENSMLMPPAKAGDAYNVFSNMIGRKQNKKNTLYGFIQANIDDFESFVYKDQGIINMFGL